MFLGLILFGCVVGGGIYLRKLNQNKIKFKLDILNFCDYLKTQISFNKGLLKDILIDYANQSKTKLKNIILEYLENIGGDKKFKITCNDLTFEEIEVLEMLFGGLGKSDINNQLILIENVRGFLSKNYEIYKEKRQKIGDLSLKLSVCLGLLIMILII